MFNSSRQTSLPSELISQTGTPLTSATICDKNASEPSEGSTLYS